MKFPAPVAISRIAELIDAKIIGEKDICASGINEIHKVEAGDLVFVDHPKYYQTCLNSAADIIIINSETDVPVGKALLVCDEPFEAYLKIVSYFRPFVVAQNLISADAVIGKDTVIQPGCFIGSGVEIGSGCIIHPNVTIYDHVRIGNNVVIHAGSVI
ncbi:MAG: LpxD N-terminal domain-containing protein, partial [Bacteroidota bacterium]